MHLRRVAPALALVLAIAGCGSRPASELPPAAEPAISPPTQSPPDGQVVPVGHFPEGIVADSRTGVVAVGTRTPAQLVLLDARSGRVRRRIRLPDGPRHLALERPGGPVLVPAEGAGVLLRVGLPGGRLLSTTRVGAHPHDAAGVAGTAFVGNEGSDSVSVLERGRLTSTFRVALQPGGVVAADADRSVAVLSVRERVVELFDPRTHRRLARAPAGLGITHAVSIDRDRLLVADTQGGAVLVVRLRPKLELQRRIDLPGAPYGLAFDPVRRRAWVTLTALNQLIELQTGPRPGAVRVFHTVRQPDTAAVDTSSGRVFVTGRAAGVVQIIDP